MNAARIIGILIFGVVLMASCNRPPELPLEPEITFECVSFKEVQNSQDSLILTINFQDGDGDLGIEGSEFSYPFNDFYYYGYVNGGRLDSLVTLSDRQLPGGDTLPPFEFPYYCTNWIINPEIEPSDAIIGQDGVRYRVNAPVTLEDTVYVTANPNHFNMFVEFYVKRNGVYEEFDWITSFEPQCGESFNGRFPILDDIDNDRPLEGKLRYGMTSSGFLFLFRNDTMKLRVRIQDRNFNTSNTIETPEFTLRSIQDSGC